MKKLSLLLIIVLVTTTGKAQLPLRTSDMIDAFHQGLVAEGGNCASIAVIKAAIQVFGVDGVFTSVQVNDGWSITLRNNTKLKLSRNELNLVSANCGFIRDSSTNAERNLFYQKVYDYAILCYAVMIKNAMTLGEGDSLRFESFSNAMSALNDGTYTPCVYRFLGLENHVIPHGWYARTKGEAGFVAWSNGHAVFASDGRYDDHGANKKLGFKGRFYGRFQITPGYDETVRNTCQ
ncbi:MAG TPA: hypothetical protein VHM26_06095 [Chitinophagaceae bacterium]|jgi:hypothetical protein|nr:hypothetical protein [Chitinophagaceae bacterium]